MGPLLQELSTLETELLETVVHAPESEQDSNLETLSNARGDLDLDALLTGNPVSPNNRDQCCCCCCPICW